MMPLPDVPDLELLSLFHALHSERHLTRAAARVGRSQPAMSRALRRMRVLFSDPLFVRTHSGMIPTPRADALAPEVRRVLDEAAALVHARPFSATELNRTFVIGTSDLFEAYLLPRLAEIVMREAPGVDVAMRVVPEGVSAELVDGRLDLVILPQPSLPDGMMSAHLFDDTFLCAVRRDHPEVKRTLSLECYTSLRHAQIAPRGRPGGPVDDALAARGLARRVFVRTPSFLAAPLLVARSDLVLTAPRLVLEPLAGPLGLRTFPLPIDVPGFRVHAAWHARAHDDPAHRWFRSAVARASRQGRTRGSAAP
ncbi:MAG: LysR family transcriptional regulator [Deltaproteobacteria bacterium]|nr:LysR family transcriptional regulator [Deltaproteobacteria bacterium]